MPSIRVNAQGQTPKPQSFSNYREQCVYNLQDRNASRRHNLQRRMTIFHLAQLDER